ncbi:CGNR zinc finger domain-containing protein [Sinomonas sp. P10A9]|uniref:CGNR zinc finger domain-containing protein n=1 Tax=Sinomonas puerhi TaxID=3238584 RepID=A0AB39L469_9MICC
MGDTSVTHAGALTALTALLATAPSPGLPEGLHYPGQLVMFATAAGLAVESDSSVPTIEELVRAARIRVRERYGEPPEEEEQEEDLQEAAAQPFAEPCPEPVFEDVAAVTRLRDRLARALWAPEAAECRDELAAIAIDFRLIPGLTDQDMLAVRSASGDFASLLAAKLVGASLQLVAAGLRGRLRRCGDYECMSPFVDRSASGHGLYCTPTCASRVRARRRRNRQFEEGQPIG